MIRTAMVVAVTGIVMGTDTVVGAHASVSTVSTLSTGPYKTYIMLALTSPDLCRFINLREPVDP